MDESEHGHRTCGNTNRQATPLLHHDSSMLPIRCVEHEHLSWKTLKEAVPASVRNMQSVKYPKSAEIVLVIGCDHYGISFLIVGHKCRIVDFDYGIPDRVHVCELLLEGSRLVDEDDIPCSQAVSGG